MKFIFSLLISFSIASCAIAQNVGLNNKEITSLRNLISKDTSASRLYRSLKKEADAALTEAPNPIDTIVSEGHLASDPRKIKTNRSLKDIDKVHALAFAYKIEGNASYLKKVDEYVLAWASVNKPQGNPINDTKFENFFIGYDMIKNEIAGNDKQRIDNWLAKMADEEINTAKNKSKKTSFNNWNSHRLMVVGSIAYILDNPVYKKYIDTELPIQLEKNLLPDGTGIDLLERDAMHYHIYTLEPLISLATILKRATGKDYYNYMSTTGSSIKKSIEFLVPFVSGDKVHPEYVNSKVEFDKKRAENKEPGFEIGANFKPAAGIGVLIQAAYFEPALMQVAGKALANKSKYPTWQSLMNAVRA